MEFTKGKWKSTEGVLKVYGLKVDEISNGEEWIAYVRGENESVRKANSQIMTCAPELLEALQGLVNDFEYYIEETGQEPTRAGYLEVSKQAIEKALK